MSTLVVPWLLYSPLDPRFAGSNPSVVMDFLECEVLSMISFGREVKPWDLIVDLRHVKEPQAEIRASEQTLSGFSRSVIESDANDLRC